MSTVNARIGILAVTDMAFIKAGTIYGGGFLADFDASVVAFRAVNAVPATGLLAYDNTTSDSFLGFSDAVGYANEPASPVVFDYSCTDFEEVVAYNLPIDTTQIIALIQAQIANLQLVSLPGQTVTYDTLPDPGSFLPEFVSNL